MIFDSKLSMELFCSSYVLTFYCGKITHQSSLRNQDRSPFACSYYLGLSLRRDPYSWSSDTDEVPGKMKLLLVLEESAVKVAGELMEIGLRIGVKV